MRNDYKILKAKRDIAKSIDEILDEAIMRPPEEMNESWKNKIIYGEEKKHEEAEEYYGRK